MLIIIFLGTVRSSPINMAAQVVLSEIGDPTLSMAICQKKYARRTGKTRQSIQLRPNSATSNTMQAKSTT